MMGVGVNDDAGLEVEAQQVAGTMIQEVSVATTSIESSESAIGKVASTAYGIYRETVIQRAIALGEQLLPRTINIPDDLKNALKKEKLLAKFTSLNDDRDIIHIFQNYEHLMNYLREMAGKFRTGTYPPPVKHIVPVSDKKRGHDFAQIVRFTAIYQPSPEQISPTAPGAHSIPTEMLPPVGQGHHWLQASTSAAGSQQYIIFQNQLQPPTKTTLPRTYGNPPAPSLSMSQGGLLLGMYVNPAPPAFVRPINRSQATYAGIQSVSGRVRGHPFALEQNQVSTVDPMETFDNARDTYTDEMDSTKGGKGGTSTWRYSQVENPAIKNKTPFTQVNVDSSLSPMGIGRPNRIYFRVQQPAPAGGFCDMLIDNTGATDYKSGCPPGIGAHAHQTDMAKSAAIVTPYPAPPVYRPGETFADPTRYNNPGYQSPPPTPFLAIEELSPEIEMWIKGSPHVGSRVKMKPPDTEPIGIVMSVISRDNAQDKTKCKVKVPPGLAKWPFK